MVPTVNCSRIGPQNCPGMDTDPLPSVIWIWECHVSAGAESTVTGSAPLIFVVKVGRNCHTQVTRTQIATMWPNSSTSFSSRCLTGARVRIRLTLSSATARTRVRGPRRCGRGRCRPLRPTADDVPVGLDAAYDHHLTRGAGTVPASRRTHHDDA